MSKFLGELPHPAHGRLSAIRIAKYYIATIAQTESKFGYTSREGLAYKSPGISSHKLLSRRIP